VVLKLRRLFFTEEGSALIFTLLGITVLIVISTALMTMVQLENQMANYQYRDSAAFYLAESGLQLSLSYLGQNPDFRGTLPMDICPTEVLTEKSRLTVTVAPKGDNLVEVTSVGEHKAVRCSLKADIWVVDQEFIYGSEENILAGDRGNLPGNFTDLPFSVYSSLADRTLSPGEFFQHPPYRGVTCIEGDLQLTEAMASPEACILLIRGRLVVEENASLVGDYFLVARDRIEIKGNCWLKGVLLTPAEVVISGSGMITGKIIAGEKATISKDVVVNGYAGSGDDLLFNLPKVLVGKGIWYGR
jgi:hypothetical protein